MNFRVLPLRLSDLGVGPGIVTHGCLCAVAGAAVTNNGVLLARAFSTLHVASAGDSSATFACNTFTRGTYQVFGTASSPGAMQIKLHTVA